MNRALDKNKKKGIEITRWKVGDADDFQSADNGNNMDIESSPCDSFDTDFTNEDDSHIAPTTGLMPRIKKIILIAFIISTFPFSLSHAWYDRTHIAVAKAAGYEQ